jgi:ABC-type Zn uptake system ZnuABC Zn-binding protein ZnuA
MFTADNRNKRQRFSAVIVLTVLFFLFPVQLLAAERIVCASYPVWLFTRFLTEGRDRFQVELLTNPETGCPHEFAPTPRDLERLTQTPILVKNGLNLETYLDKALRVASSSIVIIDSSVGVPTLSVIWGRIALEGGAEPGSNDQLPSMLPNPHIFLSPKNAKIMAANIVSSLTEIDPAGAEFYQERLVLWNTDMEDLEELITNFQQTRRGYKVVTSHGFFDYLAQDLGLSVLADLSPAEEVPPSAARLELLRQLIESEKVSAILLDPQADPAAAKTLSSELKVPGAIIDTVTSGPPNPPIDFYQSVLVEDIELLSNLFPQNYQAPKAPDSGAKGK